MNAALQLISSFAAKPERTIQKEKHTNTYRKVNTHKKEAIMHYV